MAAAPYLISDGILVLDPTPDVDAILIRADIAAKAMAASGEPSPPTPSSNPFGLGVQRSSATAEGVAFPHTSSPAPPQPRGRDPCPWGRTVRRPPRDLIFAMFGDADHPWEHVRLLARLARLTATPEARDRLRAASDDEALRTAIQAEDQAHG